MSVARSVYDRLLSELGPQHWWPGESAAEVIVGAVLVQNTSWKNVERAIANLRDAEAIDFVRLDALSHAEVEELIRPAGYFRVKAVRLKNLAATIVERYDGSLEAMREAPADRLREELLAVKGVGPETADSILLYALDKPTMVVDAYTKRIWTRHGWIDGEADYHQLQEQIAGELPDDAPLLNEMHALLVRVGNQWCKPTPKCDQCPLREMLPEGGISLE